MPIKLKKFRNFNSRGLTHELKFRKKNQFQHCWREYCLMNKKRDIFQSVQNSWKVGLKRRKHYFLVDTKNSRVYSKD